MSTPSRLDEILPARSLRWGFLRLFRRQHRTRDHFRFFRVEPHPGRQSFQACTQTFQGFPENPTTLLNTDTTNFRAMVQQFTGGPTVPFPSASPHPPSATSFSFARQVHPHVTPPAYRLQYQQPQQQNNQGYMISLSNMNNPGAGIGDGFFQRLGGNLRQPNMEVSDGLWMEMNVPRPPATSSGSNENRGNGFMF